MSQGARSSPSSPTSRRNSRLRTSLMLDLSWQAAKKPDTQLKSSLVRKALCQCNFQADLSFLQLATSQADSFWVPHLRLTLGNSQVDGLLPRLLVSCCSAPALWSDLLLQVCQSRDSLAFTFNLSAAGPSSDAPCSPATTPRTSASRFAIYELLLIESL